MLNAIWRFLIIFVRREINIPKIYSFHAETVFNDMFKANSWYEFFLLELSNPPLKKLFYKSHKEH